MGVNSSSWCKEEEEESRWWWWWWWWWWWLSRWFPLFLTCLVFTQFPSSGHGDSTSSSSWRATANGKHSGIFPKPTFTTRPSWVGIPVFVSLTSFSDRWCFPTGRWGQLYQEGRLMGCYRSQWWWWEIDRMVDAYSDLSWWWWSFVKENFCCRTNKECSIWWQGMGPTSSSSTTGLSPPQWRSSMCRLVHLRDCYSDSHISHNMGEHTNGLQRRKKERWDVCKLQEPAVSNGHESSMIRIVGIQDRRPGGSVVKVSRSKQTSKQTNKHNKRRPGGSVVKVSRPLSPRITGCLF